MEGIGHGIISLAGHLGLGRLIVLYVATGMTDDGAVARAVSEDYRVRFACAAGAAAVMVRGAEPGLPNRGAIERLLNR